MSEEMNSAEREAEEILKEAYAEAQECPRGEECAVHFRVDEVFFHPETQYARLITYVDDYVVITEDNPAYGSPSVLIKVLAGVRKSLPPRWETSIYLVGGGVIADIATEGRESHSLRYLSVHDNWEGVQDIHDTTVIGLRADLIDVSKPVER